MKSARIGLQGDIFLKMVPLLQDLAMKKRHQIQKCFFGRRGRERVVVRLNKWMRVAKLNKKHCSRLSVRAGQIFFGQKLQTPQGKLGQNVNWHQFLAPSGHILARPRAPKSAILRLMWLEWPILELSGCRYARTVPKIGVHSCFGPKSPVEFVTFDQKIFGQPYCLCNKWLGKTDEGTEGKNINKDAAVDVFKFAWYKWHLGEREKLQALKTLTQIWRK